MAKPKKIGLKKAQEYLVEAQTALRIYLEQNLDIVAKLEVLSLNFARICAEENAFSKATVDIEVLLLEAERISVDGTWHPDLVKAVEAAVGWKYNEDESLRPGNNRYSPPPIFRTLVAIRERFVKNSLVLQDRRITLRALASACYKVQDEIFNLGRVLRGRQLEVKRALSAVVEAEDDAKQRVVAKAEALTSGEDRPKLATAARAKCVAIERGELEVKW